MLSTITGNICGLRLKCFALFSKTVERKFLCPSIIEMNRLYSILFRVKVLESTRLFFWCIVEVVVENSPVLVCEASKC